MSIASSALSAAYSVAMEFDDEEYSEQSEDQAIAGGSLVNQLERRLSMAASGQTAFGRRRSSATSIHSNYSRPRRPSSIASGGGGTSVASIYESSNRNNLAATAAKRAIDTIGGAEATGHRHHHQACTATPPISGSPTDALTARDLLGRAQSYAGHGVKRLSISAAAIRRPSLASELEQRSSSYASSGGRRSSVFALTSEEVPEEADEC